MAGHSHWAGIKHKKALVDAKRGKLWSKLSRAIIVAARTGGGDPAFNPRLRVAIEAAKAASMPKENIERAIKRGTGELEGTTYEEVIYEGYGPGGVAILCEALTDNRNRTTSEIRKCFEMHQGKLGGANCVAWMFDRKGLFLFDASAVNEDLVMEVAIEAGAEDVRRSGSKIEVVTSIEDFEKVKEAFQRANLHPELAQISRIPKETVELDADTARKVLKLMERLDEHDDIQSVTSNFNIPEELLAELERAS
jgi:YebC/PmpR family DNA-binding regulatory protein